jgi:hypothetical protein
MKTDTTYTAFSGCRLVASGSITETVLKVKLLRDQDTSEEILIFEDQSGRQIDFDFRGTPDEVLQRLTSHPHFAETAEAVKPRTGPGRPKLGVVCREVSLLPRHWDWLERQPSGISAALRRMTEEAMKRDGGREQARLAREAAGKFMWAMAGNLPGFEEASRALYAADRPRLERMVRLWPEDVRNHVVRLFDESVRLEKKASSTDQAAS